MMEEGLGAYANPASILKAGAMLLRHICRGEAAARLENAMNQCAVVVTGTADGATAQSYTDALLDLL
jgi:isocitrate dehydrogenase (NAD+)